MIFPLQRSCPSPLLVSLLLAMANVTQSKPLKATNDHLNLMTSQREANADSSTTGDAFLLRSIIDQMNLISSKQLAASSSNSELTNVQSESITNQDTADPKAENELEPDEKVRPLKGRSKSANFDHRDFVVSDLEFELVLKRLLELESERHRTERSVVAASSNEELESENEIEDEKKLKLAAASSRANFTPSECFICLDEFVLKPEEEDGVKVAPVKRLMCKHEFHLHCIQSWFEAKLASSSRCPICMELMRQEDGRPFRVDDT